MELFNWTPSESGMLFILLAFSIILDPHIGHATDTQGPRAMSILGFLLSSILWVAFCAATSNTTRDKAVVGVLLFIIGFSIALIAIPNTVDVSLAVHNMNQKTLGGFDTRKVMGLAYSFMNMSYGIGSIMGPFWDGSLIQTGGWRILCISFGGLNILTTCFAWFFSGGKQKNEAAIDSDDLIT
jgi:sugar phosphate permease